MKKFILAVLIFALSQTVSALTIQQIIVSPTNGSDINIHLKVIEGHVFEYSSYTYTIENNVITLNVCYIPITLSTITTKENDFAIPNINNQTNNSNLIVNANFIHYVNNQAVCDFQNSSGTASLLFSTQLTQNVTLAAEEFINIEKNNFYPNPTNGILRFTDKNNSIKSIIIYDNLGRNVKTENDIQDKIINIEDLENGVYFLNINSSERSFTQKILLKK